MIRRIGSRAQVMHGNAKQTGGGLKKKDLKYNKRGKIVSKKMSTIARMKQKKQYGGLWTDELTQHDINILAPLLRDLIELSSGGPNLTSFRKKNIKTIEELNNAYKLDKETSKQIERNYKRHSYKTNTTYNNHLVSILYKLAKDGIYIQTYIHIVQYILNIFIKIDKPTNIDIYYTHSLHTYLISNNLINVVMKGYMDEIPKIIFYINNKLLENISKDLTQFDNTYDYVMMLTAPASPLLNGLYTVCKPTFVIPLWKLLMTKTPEQNITILQDLTYTIFHKFFIYIIKNGNMNITKEGLPYVDIVYNYINSLSFDIIMTE